VTYSPPPLSVDQTPRNTGQDSRKVTSLRATARSSKRERSLVFASDDREQFRGDVIVDLPTSITPEARPRGGPPDQSRYARRSPDRPPPPPPPPNRRFRFRCCRILAGYRLVTRPAFIRAVIYNRGGGSGCIRQVVFRPELGIVSINVKPNAMARRQPGSSFLSARVSSEERQRRRERESPRLRGLVRRATNLFWTLDEQH